MPFYKVWGQNLPHGIFKENMYCLYVARVSSSNQIQSYSEEVYGFSKLRDFYRFLNLKK